MGSGGDEFDHKKSILGLCERAAVGGGRRAVSGGCLYFICRRCHDVVLAEEGGDGAHGIILPSPRALARLVDHSIDKSPRVLF
jgi:hypothetical protein